jgi:gas vesicle protein
MTDNRSFNGVVAFVVGVGIGALVGVLFAPKSGEETRGYLVGGALDAMDTVASTGQRIAQSAREAVTDTTEHVRQTVNKKAEHIRRTVDDRTDRVRQAVNEAADQVRQVVNDTAGQVSRAVQEGERAYTKVRGA